MSNHPFYSNWCDLCPVEEVSEIMRKSTPHSTVIKL